MPTINRLLTIVHISDLHIGFIDPSTGDASVSRSAARLLAQVSWFDGVLGHHSFGLQALDKIYSDLVDDGEDPLLIVSGDITRCGHKGEFAIADKFLRSRIDLNPPRGNYVGLQASRLITVPGNHDHWPGKPVIFGGPHSSPGAGLPTPFTLRQLSNGRCLELVLLNTDANVTPWSHQRGRAVGSFQSQLATVAPLLGPRPPDTIRVLVMHHSWHQHGPILSIDLGTRGALDQFLVSHGIQLLLTGHTHDPLLQFFVPPVSGAQPILECRCGTTTQFDQIPYSWRTLFGTFPHPRSWPGNTLLVHRLYDVGNATRWDVETFVRIQGSGFMSMGPIGQVGPPTKPPFFV